jgi:hypothetical protein
VPDPALAVTGYRLTRWTSGGTDTLTLPGTDVRYVFEGTTGGYQITALTTTGEVASAPVWQSADDDAPPPAAPVRAPARVRAGWTRAGGARVTWRTPAGDSHVDRWFVAVDGEVVAGNERPGRVPASVTLRAGLVPDGDHAVVVTFASTRDGTSASAGAALGARAPLSGHAVRAGAGRYRVELVVARSWARRVCGRAACPGLRLRLQVGRAGVTAWTDSAGGLGAIVRGPRRAAHLRVRVLPVSPRARLLRVPRLVLAVS